MPNAFEGEAAQRSNSSVLYRSLRNCNSHSRGYGWRWNAAWSARTSAATRTMVNRVKIFGVLDFISIKGHNVKETNHTVVFTSKRTRKPEQRRFPPDYHCPPNGTLTSQTNHLATTDDMDHTDPLSLDRYRSEQSPDI